MLGSPGASGNDKPPLARNAPAPKPQRNDRQYISAAMDAPMLERENEAELARRWRDHGDHAAMHQMVTSHVRLVVRVASRFKGYGLPIGDLIQEGTIGLIEAANRFDPEREVRFSTYATWWIMASVQEFVVRNASIVRIGTTPAQKSLFFNLRRMRAKLSSDMAPTMTDAERRQIAGDLHVPLAAVERMEAHLSRPDRSLNAGVGGEDSDEFQNFLADPGPTPEEIFQGSHDRAARDRWLLDAMQCLTPREREVITSRFLTDGRTTLAEIGQVFGVTKERVRQIESRALSKLRGALTQSAENAADLLSS